MFTLPPTIDLWVTEVPFAYGMVGVAIFSVLFCGCCWAKCCKSKKIVSGEKYKWPNSSKFLKKTHANEPPKLFVDKYEDPMRTDVLPEDAESHWTVLYEPNGEREEVQQQMYLRFRDGNVFGLGLETIRKLCKISGKYRRDPRSNQTVLALTCKFSNELDTVLFHGCGNGTGFVGNCYIKELNRFSTFAGVPGMRQLSCDKFKGSFLLLKMPSMGDPQLRMRLHTRRVHKWAGKLFPDDTVPVPTSPMHSPVTSVGKSGDAYTAVEDTGSASSTRSRSKFKSRRSRRRGSETSASGKKGGLFGFLSFGKRRRGSPDPETPNSSTDSRSDVGEHFPPWVQRGAAELENDDNPYVASSAAGGYSHPPPMRAGESRRPSLSPINNMNYLEVEGVPGRSGPAMV